GEPCVVRTTNSDGEYRAALPPGTYDLTAYPPTGSPSLEGHRNGVVVKEAKEEVKEQDVELGASLQAPPEGTGGLAAWTGDGGIPTIYMNQPNHVTTIACSGAPLEFKITNPSGETLAGGPMHEVPGSQVAIDDSSTYEGTFTPPHGAHGTAHVKIT